MSRAHLTLLLFALLFWNAPAGGMEFTKDTVRRGIVIRATGPIEIGDAAKLRRIASEATVDERGLRRIVLESPGGNVAEAIRIATIIQNSNFVTLVGGECASACAMVLYPAGRYFVLLDGGKLGFHSCYDQNLIERPECTELIARFAGSNGFPYGSIKVFAGLAGPTKMHWITNVLAYCYGMERLVGDPAPTTFSTLCPSVRLALINGKFREPDRPLGPSFDCRKASTTIELLLCRDPELMHLDALMGELYRMMRQRVGGADTELLLSQRAWIAKRDQKCPTSLETVASYGKSRDAARCISEMTMARMEELLQINGTPQQDLSPLIKLLDRDDY
ncbi:MAG: lysozyme inhibitor LprI family protein [Rhodoplanes sp.]